MTMIPKDKWQWFGNAAHFCGGQNCRFHLATRVGKYLISTVGDYHPPSSTGENAEEIGYGRTYETMVFLAGRGCACGCGLPEINGSELDVLAYTAPKEATRGHRRLCMKWARKQ